MLIFGAVVDEVLPVLNGQLVDFRPFAYSLGNARVSRPQCASELPVPKVSNLPRARQEIRSGGSGGNTLYGLRLPRTGMYGREACRAVAIA